MKNKNLWKELIRLLCVEGQPTKAVLTLTCMGVSFIRSLFDITFIMLFLPKLPADRRGPQFDKHWSNTNPQLR
jgi:hypothetical protein